MTKFTDRQLTASSGTRPKSIDHHASVGADQHGIAAVLAFSLAGFMAQKVATKRAAAFGFAIGRDGESLLDSLMGLLLGHRDLSELLVSKHRFNSDPASSHARGGGSISIEDRLFQSVTAKN